jgi:hypothetical protein
VTAVPARQPYPSSLSLTGKLLQHMVLVRCARPALTVSLGVVLAALGVGYAEYCLTVEAYAARRAGALRDGDLGGELGPGASAGPIQRSSSEP